MLDERFFDPDFILDINSELLNTNCCIKPNQVVSAFASTDYYDSDLAKLCSVYRSIVKNHCFVDGNKRTAAVYLCSGLKSLGYSSTQDLLSDLTLDVASSQYEVDEIVKKLKSIITTR